MKRLSSIVGLGVLAGVLGCGQFANAQAAAPATAGATKAEILASPQWRQMMQEFDQWLAVQIGYTPQQVTQLKAKLDAEVNNMSAAELQQFLDQWNAKLKLLLGKEASETREWLGQYMSAMATGYRREFVQSLGNTDVANMTPGQVEQMLNRLRLRRLSMDQQESAYNKLRQQAVQTQLDANSAAQRAAQEAATQRMWTSFPTTNYQSHYNPALASPPFSDVDTAPTLQFYMTSPDGFGYLIP